MGFRVSGSAVKGKEGNLLHGEGKDRQSVDPKIPETTVKPPEQKSLKAFFAVDGSSVVIRIVDSDGNMVRQIPPEEYLTMSEQLLETSKNLFSAEV